MSNVGPVLLATEEFNPGEGYELGTGVPLDQFFQAQKSFTQEEDTNWEQE